MIECGRLEAVTEVIGLGFLTDRVTRELNSPGSETAKTPDLFSRFSQNFSSFYGRLILLEAADSHFAQFTQIDREIILSLPQTVSQIPDLQLQPEELQKTKAALRVVARYTLQKSASLGF